LFDVSCSQDVRNLREEDICRQVTPHPGRKAMPSIQAVAELASSGPFEHVRGSQARAQPFQLERRKAESQPFVA